MRLERRDHRFKIAMRRVADRVLRIVPHLLDRVVNRRQRRDIDQKVILQTLACGLPGADQLALVPQRVLPHDHQSLPRI